ncbi:uncharacterized protein LOC129963996 [Argiope bruennichi]|uniref:Methyltransferase type 11 domain-containing protein n=1 Tax=Argiope bruennichi TaxID=94029 RepID=A0A8T0F4M8_ARGBR|nr:uncharacterized protein LOC129963996 [Argiope bruennichi]KAF8783452.1 hypothetical protein HNY73_013610 [Argiope bruennichi]
MNFVTAQKVFMNLINSLENQDRAEFLTWLRDHFLAESSDSKAYFDLRTIAEDIKTLVPTEAIFPSEQVNHSKIGNGSNEPIIHVDSFLFEDDHIDALVEEGKLSRNYCKSCGSVEVAPITFISHSASVQRIEFIFQYMLPDLSGKVLLDVGSRLGAILYGAYYCSAASKIIGVEINQDLCKLQNYIIEKYDLKDRIQVICDNICNLPEVVQAANVIILNNVFECFMPKETQEEIWKWLRNNVTKPGTILVTAPSMEETLSSLETGIVVSTWLRKIPITDPTAVLKMDDQDLLSEICSYTVI